MLRLSRFLVPKIRPCREALSGPGMDLSRRGLNVFLRFCSNKFRSLDMVQLLHYRFSMPEIIRFTRSVLRMYADDHRPPHCHIVGPDFAVMVDICTLEIISGEARFKDIAEALAWAKENQATLERLWRELNERELP